MRLTDSQMNDTYTPPYTYKWEASETPQKAPVPATICINMQYATICISHLGSGWMTQEPVGRVVEQEGAFPQTGTDWMPEIVLNTNLVQYWHTPCNNKPAWPCNTIHKMLIPTHHGRKRHSAQSRKCYVEVPAWWHSALASAFTVVVTKFKNVTTSF